MSGIFEPVRTSLSPGPLLGLPPQIRSMPSMPAITVQVEEREKDGATVAIEVPPLAGPPAPVSAQQAPVAAPEPVVEAQPSPSSSPALPPAAGPPATPLMPGGAPVQRPIALVAVAVLLLTATLLVLPRRHLSTNPPASGESGRGVFATTFDERRFQRGNIHTHTSRSDGTHTPDEVVAWYRSHGYQFLAITDHDVFVRPSEIQGAGPGFVLIPGEEISSSAAGKAVHIQALCIDHPIPGGRFDSPVEALAQAIAAVRAQNGFAVVNHPNFDWALGVADIAPLTGSYALEIWSGHPFSHSEGDATRPSHQAIWDELLTRGRHVTAVAVDDAHTLPDRPAALELYPGRAWIETFGELGSEAVCDALRGGRFYASSGVAFRRIRLEPARFTVWVDGPRDTVEFLAGAAHVLARVPGPGPALAGDADGFAATYALQGGEPYVRAVARGPDGAAAWTQAYYVRP